MNIREWLNKNPRIAMTIVLVVLGVCLTTIFWNLPRDRPQVFDVYYYDLNTGRLFTGTTADYPPIQAPSDTGEQRSGVIAHVFACGSCPGDLSGRTLTQLKEQGVMVPFIGTSMPQDQLGPQRQHGPPQGAAEAPPLVDVLRATEGGPWVGVRSAEGSRLRGLPIERCGRDLEACKP